MTAGAVHAASAVFVLLHKKMFMKILLRSTLFFSSALVAIAAVAAPKSTLTRLNCAWKSLRCSASSAVQGRVAAPTCAETRASGCSPWNFFAASST